jgi:hypothetical protein
VSRPRMLRPMAPDLAVLGDQIEAAVHRDVRRRRARRQAVLNAAASLIVVIPLAISIATAEMGGEDMPVGAAGASATLNWTPGFDLTWRHIPEKPVQTLEWARCLDAKDCRVVSDAVPFAVDFPPRRA